jgi:hypothetical protein
MNKKAKKSWYTVAWLTREGSPDPHHRLENFTQVYKTKAMLADDLARNMTRFSLGAYAAVAWPGQVSEQVALRSNLKPVLQVFEGGAIQEIT